MSNYYMWNSQKKSWRSKFGGFCHFLKFTSIAFLDIAQNYSLGQYQRSSGAQTSKKSFVAQIGVEMIFSILMLLSLQSNLFVTHASNILYLGI